MTDAERQQRCRDKKGAALADIALALLKARKDEDWAAVESLAKALLRL